MTFHTTIHSFGVFPFHRSRGAHNRVTDEAKRVSHGRHSKVRRCALLHVLRIPTILLLPARTHALLAHRRTLADYSLAQVGGLLSVGCPRTDALAH